LALLAIVHKWDKLSSWQKPESPGYQKPLVIHIYMSVRSNTAMVFVLGEYENQITLGGAFSLIPGYRVYATFTKFSEFN
jgi:hypothetical protein